MNILGIGCHPDDLEIQCGGTLAKYAKLGHKVFMLHIANGDKGHKIIQPKELADIRRKEAQNAAKVLGAESLAIEVPDMSVDSSNIEIRNKVVEIIRYTKADLIITHNPDDYMRDHVETHKLALDSSFGCTVPHLITETENIDNFPPVFYMDTLAGINFQPTEYVDITGEIEQKIEANACHESQIKWMAEHDKIDFLDFIRTCNKFRGLQASVPFAEGFKQYAGWPRFKTERLLP